MARVRCKICKKVIERETAYSPLKGQYYCSVSEYNNSMEDKHYQKKTKDLLNELFGYTVVNTFMNKRLNELRQSFTYKEIYTAVDELMLDLHFSIESVNFNNESHKVNYVFVFIRNSIKDIIDRNNIVVVDEIVPEVQPQFLSVNKYRKKQRRTVKDIIFDEGI